LTTKTIKKRAKNACVYTLLILLSALAVIPLIWALSTSLKPDKLIFSYPPKWIPSEITLKHYITVLFSGSFTGANFGRAIVNTIGVALVTAVITLLVSTLASYSTARLRVPGSNGFLVVILSTTMIPGISILVPLYIFSNKLHIYDTYFVLIMTHVAWRIPFTTWLLHGFFKNIPKEIEEAALIDGCTHLGAFFRISLPLVKPGLAASLVLVLVYVWQDFLVGFTLILSEEKRVATVALYDYLSQFGIQWGELMAATLVAVFPVLALFLILQRQFIHGLTGGAIK